MRLNRSKIMLISILAYSLAVTAVPIYAQEPGSTVAQQPAADSISDIFVGRGSRGPYIMSWRNIAPGSESIIVSGRRIAPGVDYSIDPVSGSIAFSEPLQQNTVASVSYNLIPGKSVSNQGGTVNLPLNMSLLDSDRGSLSIVGVYKGSTNGASNQGMSVFGLGGGMKLGGNTQLTSQYFVGQGDGVSKSSSDDRSAMKFGTSTSIGAMQLNASYMRAGSQFAGSNEYGMQKGKQLLDLSGAYGKTSDQFYSSFSFKQQEDLAGEKKGALQTNLSSTMAFSLPTDSKLTLTHQQTETGSPNTAGTASTNDSLQLEQKLGDQTTAVASVQRLQSESNSNKTETNTTRFGMQTSAISNTQLRGNWMRKDMGNSGDETSLDLGAKVSAGKKTTLDAGYKSLASSANGQQTLTSMRMATSLVDAVQFQGGISWKDSTQAGAETAFDMNVNANPNKRLSLGASHSETDSEKNGQQAKTDVKLAVKPLDGIDFSGDFSRFDAPNNGGITAAGVKVAAHPITGLNVEASARDKQTDTGEQEQQRAVRVETQPVDFLKISGGMSALDSGTAQRTNTNARVELAPGKRLHVAHSYSSEVNGEKISTVKDYAGSVKPIDFLEVSGGYKTRQATGADNVDSKSMKLALDPVKFLNLTGQYTYNPEDCNGQVLSLESKSLGVAMKLGVMSLSGAYTQNLEYVLGRTSQEKSLGMRLRMFGNGQLNTGYKIATLMGGLQLATETYTLGYTHDIGSAFNMSLLGEMVHRAQDDIDQKDEYKASAKLGMKF